MRFTVHTDDFTPADLVHARFTRLAPTPEELLYLAGFLIEVAPAQADLALTYLEARREAGQ
jgi:hypothetical protein